jgi:hypothetical protein
LRDGFAGNLQERSHLFAAKMFATRLLVRYATIVVKDFYGKTISCDSREVLLMSHWYERPSDNSSKDCPKFMSAPEAADYACKRQYCPRIQISVEW